MTPELYFEDLPVGRRFVSPAETVTAALLEPFARTVGGDSGGGGSAGGEAGATLSPAQVAGLTMRLLLSSEFKTAGGTLGAGVAALTWPETAAVGDVLRVEIEVVEARRSRSRPDRGLITTRNRTVNASGAVVQEGSPTIIIPVREPMPSPA